MIDFSMFFQEKLGMHYETHILDVLHRTSPVFKPY